MLGWLAAMLRVAAAKAAAVVTRSTWRSPCPSFHLPCWVLGMHLYRHVKVICPDSNGDGMPPCLLAPLATIGEFCSE
jgi:hypothetical protein